MLDCYGPGHEEEIIEYGLPPIASDDDDSDEEDDDDEDLDDEDADEDEDDE